MTIMVSSAASVAANSGFFVNWLLVPFLRPVLNGMHKMEQYLESSCQDINYTVVRPPGLKTAPLTGGSLIGCCFGHALACFSLRQFHFAHQLFSKIMDMCTTPTKALPNMCARSPKSLNICPFISPPTHSLTHLFAFSFVCLVSSVRGKHQTPPQLLTVVDVSFTVDRFVYSVFIEVCLSRLLVHNRSFINVSALSSKVFFFSQFC